MKRKNGLKKLFVAVTSLALVCFFAAPSIAQRKVDKGLLNEEKIVVVAPDDPYAEVGIVSIGLGVSEPYEIPDNLVAPDDPTAEYGIVSIDLGKEVTDDDNIVVVAPKDTHAEVGIISIDPGKEVPGPVFDKYFLSPQPLFLFANTVLITPASSYSFGGFTSYSPVADVGGQGRTAASFGNSYGNTFNTAPAWSSYPANTFNFGWAGSNLFGSFNLFGFNNSYSSSNSNPFGFTYTAASSNPVDWSRNSFGTYGIPNWSANPFTFSFGPFNYNFNGILPGSHDIPTDIGLVNPAATYCNEHGGTYRVMTDEDGSQRGVCIYGDGCECPDSLYFKGECKPCEDTTSAPEPVAPRYDGNTGNTGIPNPSAVNCEQMGGIYEIRTDEDGAQNGFCIFSDGTECEGWSLFRGECLPGGSAPEPVAPRLGGNTGNIGMPNPSAVNCEQNGGIYEIRTAEDGSQNGVCIFNDGTECDAWAFFRGECQSSYEGPQIAPQLGGQTGGIGMANPASTYCEENGGTIEMRTDANGGQYGVCVLSDGTECDEWAYFRGECQP